MNRQKLVTDKSVSISCIVPVYNEQVNLAHFIQDLSHYLVMLTQNFEIIIVNDGSTDASFDVAQRFLANPQIKLINFSRNFGKEIAITAGLEHASMQTTVIIDADFQHPFAVIGQFLQEWANGYDMVYGVRADRVNETLFKKYFAKIFYQLMRKIAHIDIPANAGDFRLMDRKVVNALVNTQERARFMKGLYAWVGFSSKAVVFEVADRQAGKSQWHFRKLFDLAILGLVSFSDIPLRVWSFIGVIISMFSFLSIGYIFLDTLIFGAEVPGYATLLTIITFFGGIQLLSIGILGEYIAKIFNEVKQRPKYIVESKYNFTDTSKYVMPEKVRIQEH